MKKSRLLWLLVVYLLAACQSAPIAGEDVSVAGGSYKNISARDLNQMLKDKDFVLVNVHIPFAGNIADTDVSIPYNEIEQNISQLPADTSARIVLYCKSGRMSEIAAEQLLSLGYTNIWNLQGGMVEWENEGFVLEK